MVKRCALVVLDGWGIRSATDGNAIHAADTPSMDLLKSKYADSYAELEAHGLAVGLHDGLMGNSEVGHLTIGAGRVIYQDIVRIDLSIQKKEFPQLPALQAAFAHAKKNSGRVQFFGLVSDGGIHSHINHLLALFDAAQESGVPSAYAHCFTDGRDTPTESGTGYIEKVQNHINQRNYGSIATVQGRFYAMDRDKRWDRIEVALQAIVHGQGEAVSPSALLDGIRTRYAAKETDEFLKPFIVDKEGCLQEGDALVFFDFRADRMREIVECLGVEPPYESKATIPSNMHISCMAKYNEKFDFPVLFPKPNLDMVLSEVISRSGNTQFHTAETEKYAHVTFFFNGGRELVFDGELRDMVPSPKVATYDLAPGMNNSGVADSMCQAIKEKKECVFFMCNFAPPDMVGHTGNYDAAVVAAADTDRAIGQIYQTCMEEGVIFALTADHGNCEVMVREDGGPHTMHTTNAVPFVTTAGAFTRKDGVLSDVAPTLLKLMELPVPDVMEGKPLL